MRDANLHEELRNVSGTSGVELATELGVGIDDSRDALGRVESSDLNKVLAWIAPLAWKVCNGTFRPNVRAGYASSVILCEWHWVL